MPMDILFILIVALVSILIGAFILRFSVKFVTGKKIGLDMALIIRGIMGIISVFLIITIPVFAILSVLIWLILLNFLLKRFVSKKITFADTVLVWAVQIVASALIGLILLTLGFSLILLVV